MFLHRLSVLCTLEEYRALRSYRRTAPLPHRLGKPKKHEFSLERRIYYKFGNYIQFLGKQAEYLEFLQALKCRKVSLNLDEKLITVVRSIFSLSREILAIF